MDASSLRFGLFHAPFHSQRLDPTWAFERDLQLAEHLDRLGFDELWFGEHHSGGMEMSAAPELMIAAAAQRTKWIRLGTGVKSLPFHNPFMLAEMMAQLDHMTRGRAMFGVGPGALATDALMLGIEIEEMRPRMEEALGLVVRLMQGESVTAKSQWFDLRDARLQVGCFTKPMMEMAVTSVRSPAGVVAAGRHGLGVLTLGGTNDASLERHRDNWRVYEEEARRHGHRADRATWRIAVPMHIAETREQAIRDTEWGFREFVEYTHDVLPAASAYPRDVKDPARYAIEQQIAIIGTPADAIAEIERIVAGVGGFGVVLVMGIDLAPWPAIRRSYELLAEVVKPHFTAANRLRRASYAKAAEGQTENLKKTTGATEKAKAAYLAKRQT